MARAESVRDSFSQFRLRDPNGGALVFARRSFGWKLIAFRGPADQHDKVQSNNDDATALQSAERDEIAPTTATENDAPFLDATGATVNDENAAKPPMTANWLIGTWAALPVEARENPNASCDTEGVTFEAGGRFSEMEQQGRYRTDGSSIAYYDRVITPLGSEEEDRSEFDAPKTSSVEVLDANTIKEAGVVFSRCNGG